MALAGVLVAATGAVFALLAWLTSRERQPFRLGNVRDSLVVLTRVRRPKVLILEIYVLGVAPITTRDRAGTAQYRTLKRDDSLILDVSKIPVGYELIVAYKRLWPWERLAHHLARPRWIARFVDLPDEERQRRLKSLTEQRGKWKYWTRHFI